MRNVWLSFALSLSLVACGSPPKPDPVTSADSSTPTAATSSGDSSVPAPLPSTNQPVQPVEVAGGNTTTTASPPVDAPKKLERFVVARPAFAYTLKRAVTIDVGPAPKITKASEKKNKVTDDAAWFEKNGLKLAGRQPTGPRMSVDAPLASTPAELGPDKLHHLLDHGDHVIAMYGPSFGAMRVLMLLDGGRKPKAVFDFNSFVTPPEVVPGDEQFTNAEVSWAIEKDGVLYVATGHNTYAKSSKGKNAFVSAVDSKTGELLWQSEPLVCNAQNFVIHGGHIICGYGFTAEPDFLYVISRADGKTVSKTPMSTGPSFLVMKDGKLYVRAYDTDFVFDVK